MVSSGCDLKVDPSITLFSLTVSLIAAWLEEEQRI